MDADRDTELAALERTLTRAEREAWDDYQRDQCEDDCPVRDRWLDALSALNRARIHLARRDG